MPERNNTRQRVRRVVSDSVSKRHDEFCTGAPKLVTVKSERAGNIYQLSESCKRKATTIRVARRTSLNRKQPYEDELRRLGVSSRSQIQSDLFSSMIKNVQEDDVSEMLNLPIIFACILEGFLHFKQKETSRSETYNIRTELEAFIREWSEGRFQERNNPELSKFLKKNILLLLMN